LSSKGKRARISSHTKKKPEKRTEPLSARWLEVKGGRPWKAKGKGALSAAMQKEQSREEAAGRRNEPSCETKIQVPDSTLKRGDGCAKRK